MYKYKYTFVSKICVKYSFIEIEIRMRYNTIISTVAVSTNIYDHYELLFIYSVQLLPSPTKEKYTIEDFIKTILPSSANKSLPIDSLFDKILWKYFL